MSTSIRTDDTTLGAVPTMLRNERRSMTFYLPHLPANIVNEMVDRGTRTRHRPPIKALSETEVVNERKDRQGIFTENISVASRLISVDFRLGEGVIFHSANLPENSNYYRSKTSKRIHLMAWRHRQNRVMSRSPSERGQSTVSKGPQYGIFHQGLPGKRTIILPTLLKPNYQREQSEKINIEAQKELQKKAANPPNANGGNPNIPPNTPAPGFNMAHRQTLSRAAPSTTTFGPVTYATHFAEGDNKSVTLSPSFNPLDTSNRFPISPRAALKQVLLGENVPLINVDVKMKQQLRDIYPMYDDMARRRQNATLHKVTPHKVKDPNKNQVCTNVTQNLNNLERLQSNHVHTQNMKILIPNKDYIDVDEVKKVIAREESFEIPNKPLLDDHVIKVKSISKSKTRFEMPTTTQRSPEAPPTSAAMVESNDGAGVEGNENSVVGGNVNGGSFENNLVNEKAKDQPAIIEISEEVMLDQTTGTSTGCLGAEKTLSESDMSILSHSSSHRISIELEVSIKTKIDELERPPSSEDDSIDDDVNEPDDDVNEPDDDVNEPDDDVNEPDDDVNEPANEVNDEYTPEITINLSA